VSADEDVVVLTALADHLVTSRSGNGSARVDARALEIVGRATRRRSELWFVGVHGERAPRWVVKRPHTESRQGDLAAPLSATDQLAALRLLTTHLQDNPDRVCTPEPVLVIPELGACVMTFVPGPSVTALVRPAVLGRPTPLMAGSAAAADVLRAVHSVQPEQRLVVDLAERWAQAADASAGGMRAAGLAYRAPAARPAPGVVEVAEVLLHGDFAPENVLVSPSGPCCLDPELSRHGPPEVDLARYLTMLADAPAFVLGTRSSRVQRLRREASRVFLDRYYRGASPGPLLQIQLHEMVAARWATRHLDVERRRPPAQTARTRLLAEHFSQLLAEISSGYAGLPALIVP
jgi:aminoglycoside phosphotransferase (APT) family kinase protein